MNKKLGVVTHTNQRQYYWIKADEVKDMLLSLGFCCDDQDFKDGCACGRCRRIKEQLDKLDDVIREDDKGVKNEL